MYVFLYLKVSNLLVSVQSHTERKISHFITVKHGRERERERERERKIEREKGLVSPPPPPSTSPISLFPLPLSYLPPFTDFPSPALAPIVLCTFRTHMPNIKGQSQFVWTGLDFLKGAVFAFSNFCLHVILSRTINLAKSHIKCGSQNNKNLLYQKYSYYVLNMS